MKNPNRPPKRDAAGAKARETKPWSHRPRDRNPGDQKPWDKAAGDKGAGAKGAGDKGVGEKRFKDKSRFAAKPKAPKPVLPEDQEALYGIHSVREALANPRRRHRRLLATENALIRLAEGLALPIEAEIVKPEVINKLLPADAVHQGAYLESDRLPMPRLSEIPRDRIVIALDQVTDPHNVGAIMRSAVAFGAGALVTTARHSPAESGVLAKAASGALEHIDLIEVKNLAEALQRLHDAGFSTIGLDSEGPAELEKSFAGDRIALVLGAEGKGLRQKTRETVSALARLDMPGPIRSLNVSNAAAIALYAARSHLGRKS